MSAEKYKRIELRLLPTKEQEILMWKTVDGVRQIKNIMIQRCFDLLDDKEHINSNSLKKELTVMLKDERYMYLKQISRHSMNTAIKETENTFVKYFKKQINRPTFKKKGKTPNTFSVRNDLKENGESRCRRDGFTYKIEKLGSIKFSKNSYYKNKNIFDEIEYKHKFTLPVIKHDGKYWYLSLLYRDDLVHENQGTKELTNEVIGIDLGIKTLATCSNGKSYDNINKSKTVRKLEKQLKRKQRQVSRKYEMNKDKLRIYHLDKEGKPVLTKTGKKKTSLLKTKNIIKLEKEILHLYRRLSNIRNNHIHTMTKEIVESYPQEIVIEDLGISNMIKNRYLSKHVREAKFYEIRKQLTYKCEDRGILLTVSNRWYPSSQTCSSCGNRKTKQHKLQLKHRTFTCECGNSLDRDLNASLNLQNYRYSKWYQDNILTT